MVYDAICEHCGSLEIEKSMHAQFPGHCPNCGQLIQRVYSSVPVMYNAPGFTAYDEELRRHTTPERYARFVKERDQIRKAAKEGTLVNVD